MATEVSRSLSEINAELSKIDESLGKCKDQTSLLSKALQINPNSLVLINAKYQALGRQVEEATKKVKLLREQQKLMVSEGVDKESKEFKDLTTQIKKAESQVRSLKGQLEKVDSQKFNNLKSGLNGVSRACSMILASVVAIGVAFASSGDEIAKASEKYNISAATYQYWKNIFSKTTGNDNGYMTTLTSVTNLLGQVAKGSSKAATALATVGLSLEDINGLSSQEAMLKIINALKNIEDEETRIAVATALLGNTGTEIAMVAGLTTDEIASLNEEMNNAGLITDEQAQAAAKLNDAYDNLKNEFKAVIVELGTSLIPMFQTIINLASAFTPLISGIAKIMQAIGPAGQVLIVVILGLLVVIPKLIIGVYSLNTALTALGANPISAKFLLIAAAVAAVTLGVTALAGAITNLDSTSATIDTTLAESTLQHTASATSGNSEGTSGNTYVTYNDYGTQNVTIDQDIDIDEVIDALHSKKIQVGG